MWQGERGEEDGEGGCLGGGVVSGVMVKEMEGVEARGAGG